MRVELTFAFTAEGQVFNPYVTVSGLTKIELPSNNPPPSTCSSARLLNVPLELLLLQYQVYPWKGTGIQLFRRMDISYL